jgi:ABC-type multidrug transport system fused ATPase/permease subunit
MIDAPFRTLLGYVTPHKGVLLLAVLLMAAESAIALASPWIAGRFTQTLLEPEAAGLGTGLGAGLGLLHLLALWGALLVAQSVLSLCNQLLLGNTAQVMLSGLRTRLYDHLQALPIGYFHARRRGDVLSLLGNDAGQISSFVTGTLVGLLPLVITFFGAFYFMFRISPLIAGLAVVLVPVFVIVTKLVGRRLRPLSSEWVRTHAEMFSTLEENIGMLPAIKSFTREAHESERFQRSNRKLLHIARRQLLAQSLLSPTVRLLSGGGMLLMLYLATLQVESGALQPGEMVSVLLYAVLLTRPASGLASVYGSVLATRGAAQRLIDAFAQAPEPDDADARPIGAVAGEIRFEQVRFGYPGRPEVLRGLDLTIRAGETVALTGENGSGKSTIVHVLMRFADPEAGRVLIDGTDIRGVRIASLRRQIGLVAQHVLLLNGTVRENIAYARPDADQPAIEAAAAAAQAHDFIQALPQGYDTVIGDQGIRLSGGQRQRISLARALLKDPPILVLDEATAMFDPAGEAAFIDECRSVLEQRTVILITHRPASLALADRVVLLKNGRL